jgi:integrase
LQWRDVDFLQKFICVNKAVADVVNSENGKYEVVVGSPKNKQSTRQIPCTDEFMNVLKTRCKAKNEYIVHNSGNGLYSPNTWSDCRYGKFMSDMAALYSNLGVEIPMLNPHECRHTRASLWVNSGLNIYAIARCLGHTDTKMLLKTYAHSKSEDLRRLMGMD